jgi:magnesium-protoporphyrin IX monomethyl ester (oxidative) cyclase
MEIFLVRSNIYESLQEQKGVIMRVLLINPPWISKKEYRDYFRVEQPIGLGYIASVLEREKHDVMLLDASADGWKKSTRFGDKFHIGMSYQEINTIVDSFKPDVIGISIVSSLLKENGFSLARSIKHHNKKIKIVVGGAHPSVAKEECLSKEYINFVVIGEGELTMLDLINELEKSEPRLREIKGIAYRENSQMIYNGPRDKIEHLDSIPFPARDQFPMEDYFMAGKKLLSTFSLSTYNKRWATMYTSRGCPHNCIFCSIHLTMGRKWRGRSAVNVVSEIELLVREYGIEHIAFLDDNMSMSKKRMHEICDLIIGKKLKFTWSTPNGLRANTLDEELLVKMKKSGCTRIAVAAESGSQRVLDEVIKKKLDLKDVEKVIKICHKIGLKVDVFFIFGLIGEKKEDLEKTLDFAKHLKKLGTSGFNFAVATPFLGTEFYKQLALGGYIDENNFNEFTIFRKNSFIGTSDFTPSELAEFKQRADKINSFPFAYAHFAFLLLIRSPSRFFRMFISMLKERFVKD